MEFDWAKAIAKNRDDLLLIVTRLFLMAGLRTGVLVEALPRYLRVSILALLRPAEFAARRLIVMAAWRMEVAAAKPEAPTSPRLRGEVDLPRDAQQSGLANRVRGNAMEQSAPRPPHQLRLARDARKPSYPLHRGARTGPGSFALFDPWKRYGSPWLDPDEDDDWLIEDAGPDPDELVDATGLCNRIRALEHALQDLDAQALRLARWRARRGLETARPRRWAPLRPGLPPGWKKRPRTDIAEVVKECHDLARFAIDTS